MRAGALLRVGVLSIVVWLSFSSGVGRGVSRMSMTSASSNEPSRSRAAMDQRSLEVEILEKLPGLLGDCGLVKGAESK